MTTSKNFIDSNVLVYLFDFDERIQFTKPNLLVLWANFLRDCNVIPSDSQSFHRAIQLVNHYNFQLFDALIVAYALNANCEIFYSEDMQHNMLVENKLTIINPFL